VVHFADVDLVELLLRRPDAAALRLIPEWAGRLREADGEKSGDLRRTIRAFADCDLNVKRTARSLKLHPNTIYFRLNRIKKLTGVDPRSFSGASLLLTALRLLDAKASGNRPERLI
jgi:DNA-binding PucR family transcriptional regulator